MKEIEESATAEKAPIDGDDQYRPAPSRSQPHVPSVRVIVSILLLFINYFLAQYDKFVLSYFQADVIRTLSLSSSEYGLLSGYATGIVYALLAIPVAFVADEKLARVWVLSIGPFGGACALSFKA